MVFYNLENYFDSFDDTLTNDDEFQEKRKEMLNLFFTHHDSDSSKRLVSKIFDIDKKPLGDIQSRSAPLENIESLQYKRKGLLSIFFNFGTVYIHIGAEHFEFKNVHNPALVQKDINKRYIELKRRKKEASRDDRTAYQREMPY